MQTLRDAVRQLLRDMRSQKLRTFLTTFGIVWGTVAVTLLLAFGGGMQKQMKKNAAGLGDPIVICWPGLTSIPYEGLGRGRRIRVSEADIRAVRNETPEVALISSEYSETLKLVYGEKILAVDVSGVAPEFGDMRNLIPQEGGRFLNQRDWTEQRRVLFIGDKLASDVFGKASPVGKTVVLGGSPFLIIGALQKKVQNSSYSGRDNFKGFIPGTTFQALTGQKYVDNFVFKPASMRESKKAMDAVRAVLGRTLRFDRKDKEALGAWDTTENFKFQEIFFLSFRLFLGIIGSFTLIVGGIGVSNIMNVVVEERMKEVGIKMALGAKEKSILRQFMLETFLLTGLGGAIGLGIAFTICALFPKLGFTEQVGDPTVSPLVAGITAAILGITALLAGYFPAREASRLDPVVAMKL